MGVLLVALAGLFAMHGLSGHGTGHGRSAEMVSSTATDPVQVAHGEHEPGAHHAVITQDGATGAAQGLPTAVPGDDSHENALIGLLGLCLAVLVAAVVGLAAWLSRSGLVRRGAAVRHGLSGLALIGRDRGPPGPLVLSIQRC